MYLVKKSRFWYVVHKVNGREVYTPTRKENKREARMILKQIEDEGILKNIGIKGDITLFKFCDEIYLPACKANKAEKTYKSRIGSVANIKECFGDLSLDAIDYTQIERFKIWRRDHGVNKKKMIVSNRTINIDLECLKNLLREAKKHGHIKEVPIIEKFKEEGQERSPSMAQYESLKKNATPYSIPIIELLANTGLRHGELCNLRFENIDYDQRILKVANDADWKTKTRQERLVPLNDEALRILYDMSEYWIDPSSMRRHTRAKYQRVYVFCDRDGSRIKSVNTALHSAMKKAGMKFQPCHSLRHFFGHLCADNGVPPDIAQRVLGHSNITTTMIYYKHSDRYYRDSIMSVRIGPKNDTNQDRAGGREVEKRNRVENTANQKPLELLVKTG